MDLADYIIIYGMHDFEEQVIDGDTCQLCSESRNFHEINDIKEP